MATFWYLLIFLCFSHGHGNQPNRCSIFEELPPELDSSRITCFQASDVSLDCRSLCFWESIHSVDEDGYPQGPKFVDKVLPGKDYSEARAFVSEIFSACTHAVKGSLASADMTKCSRMSEVLACVADIHDKECPSGQSIVKRSDGFI